MSDVRGILVAAVVLSAACSATNTERVWKTAGDIHTKKRNRLGAAMLQQNVFVRYNRRLMTVTRTDAKRLERLFEESFAEEPDDE